ncbi:HlyD family efflux transporter periplasmic adaptor subunit [Oceanimonas pelagia]|uniref:HlyD family efflux transporter periplasmic adaptor subunit n=1 Tax=Oceanimonas pelagia TaxID=3028314 RepID=A0AA50Q804_9GAMM|nr:HlyD family efflux transporter periplasmic adaptor subunit [Oceanimonas pelagia]WMC11185.1 HlyD family efflux transporter periplasmic adaptor subunit [Oceanimonas pelagia]
MFRLLVMGCGVLLAGCQPAGPAPWLGTLERDRIELLAPASERVVAQPVAEGDKVSAGTLLVQLNPERLQLEVNRQQAHLRQAEAELALLRAGSRAEDIAAAKAELEQLQVLLPEAGRNLERVRILARRELASQAELDRVQAAFDRLQAQAEAARQRLSRAEAGSRSQEIDAAEAAQDARQAGLALARFHLNELAIEASRDGVVESLPYRVGDRVAAGAVVAVLETGTAPYAEVYVPAPARTGLHIGGVMRVWVEGEPEPFAGTLSWVASEPVFGPYYALSEGERSRLMYLARVQLPPEAAGLPSGVPAQVSP